MLQWNPKQSWVLHLDKKTSPIYVLNIRVRKIKCLVFQWFVLAKFRYAQNNSRWVESLARILMSPPQWKPLCFFGEMRRQLWESWPSSPHILHCVVTPHCLISDLYQIYRFGLGMASELCIHVIPEGRVLPFVGVHFNCPPGCSSGFWNSDMRQRVQIPDSITLDTHSVERLNSPQ